MEIYQISINKLAELVNVNPQNIRNITIGKSAITPPTALRLAKVFGTTPEYWLDLQTKADIAKAAEDPALEAILKTIAKAVKPAPVKAPPPAKAKSGSDKKPAKTGTAPKKPQVKKA
jgi:addiction module HigA family antidote